MPVEAPDLNTYLFLQQEALSKIAFEIGEKADAERWAKRATGMARRLVKLKWDKQAGLFWATRNGQRIDVVTPLNLFPLITGRMPGKISDRLVQHLLDPKEFWSPYPIPSVAMNHPEFDPNQMWRGPTWANINYLMIEGLWRSGYPGLARELRQRTLNMLSGQDDFYEYYHPLTGKKPPKAASIFGWSAAVFIDLAIQATRDGQAQEAGEP
jgi:glycogen debranching enzyme